MNPLSRLFYMIGAIYGPDGAQVTFELPARILQQENATSAKDVPELPRWYVIIDRTLDTMLVAVGFGAAALVGAAVTRILG